MYALGAGVFAFLVAYLFDWASLKGLPGGKQVLIAVVLALHGYALYAAVWAVERFTLPAALTWLGWVLLPLSAFLLIYSLFLEIPFTAAYLRDGAGAGMVTTGTYALVRHPWMLWYTLTLVSLLLVTHSWVLLVAAPAWVAMGVIRVVVQDRVVFPRMFADYEQYRHQTPMLVPSWASVAACVKTLKPREAVK